MNPNNLSGITIDDNLLDESDYSAVSSVGTDLKQILEKIKQLETKVAQNNAGQSGACSSSSVLLIGEKLDKLKKEMEGIRAAKHVDIGAFEELKKGVEKVGHENQKFAGENEKMKEKIDGMKKKFAEKLAEMKEDFEGKIDQKDRQIHKIKEENGKLAQEVKKLAEKDQGMEELNGQMDVLKKENEKMDRELRQILGQKAEKNALTDLSNRFDEMQEKQTTESATLDNLSEKIAKLEACTKIDLLEMKENKWAQCGPKFAISEGGLVVKYSGPRGSNSVRAQLPIPKFNLNANKSPIAYFEVEIVAITGGISIGFCTQQFPLEGNPVGNGQNSIGIWGKRGIYIDGNYINFGNGGGYFQAGEVIGIGIVHFPANSKMKCFASCNGNLLGKADLPIKFADLELFPAVSMAYQNDSIRANFGANPWKYNPIPE